jgi:adenylate cyclase
MAQTSTPVLEVMTLGPFVLRGSSGAIKLNGKKLAGLLAYLACSSPTPQSRDKLRTLLWGSHFDRQAGQNLRRALTQLRQVIGADGLNSEGEAIALQSSLVSCDAQTFEALLRRDEAKSLAAAVALYRGPFLANVTIPEEAWNDWLDGQRRRYEGLAVDAVVRLAELELEAAQPAEARKYAERAIEISPFREDAHRLLMSALVDAGRKADALKHYDDFAALLARELASEPDTTTKTLAEDLRGDGGGKVSGPKSPSRPYQVAERSPASVVVSDAEDNKTARLLVVARKATSEQTREIANLLSKYRGTGPSSEGAPRWVLEASSAAEAARAAFEIQAAVRAMAGGEPAPQIGIGAHIAAAQSTLDGDLPTHLAELCGGVQLIVTEEVRDHLVDGLDATVRDLGFVQPSPNHTRVRAFAVDPASADASTFKPSLTKLQPTIAVLPFDLLVDDAIRWTLAELLADEIINAICRSNQLDVLSRLSTRQFAQRNFDVGQIRSRLDADYVVGGTVRGSRGTAMLAVELTDAASGLAKWTQSYAAKLDDPLGVQEVATRVASEVMAAILVQETKRAAVAPMSTLASYTLLFTAITLMDRWTRASFLRSRELLTELLARVPKHPLPNAWMAVSHIRSISQNWSTNADVDARAAIDFAQRGLDGDPTYSLALAIDGWANTYGTRRLDIAGERLAQAVEMNPNDSLAWLYKGVTHGFRGEVEEGVEAAEHALRLSPLDPRRSYFESLAASCFLGAHRFDRTIELASSSLRANQLHASTLRVLAAAQWHSGRAEEAKRHVAQMLAVEPSFSLRRYRTMHPGAGQSVHELVADVLRACGAPR